MLAALSSRPVLTVVLMFSMSVRVNAGKEGQG
jgi:hypothetical protein